MATWVTHLMIADRILAECPALDRRGYCVGCIAPDCNVENEDWTAFTPSREVTHWMGGSRKTAADCSRFLAEYLKPRILCGCPPEEHSFLLGYYSHLIADAEFQRCIRDEVRVQAVWKRIHTDKALHERALGMAETWDSVKQLIPRADRYRELEWIEADYLDANPGSGYLTEILPLKEFPDYLPYLPAGSIVRKIGVMGTLPARTGDIPRFIAFSKEEYASYIRNAVQLTLAALNDHRLLPL